MKSSIQIIDEAKIDIIDRIRPEDPSWTQAIAASIGEIGQQHPISVLKHGDRFHLGAGLHRMAAIRLLGWDKIEAKVYVGDENTDIHAIRLLEISENLIRKDLSALERAFTFLELKRIHEARFPETGHGKKRRRQANDNIEESKVATVATLGNRFTTEVSDACGLSERAIQRSVQIAENTAPELRAKLFPTWLADHQAQLIKLSEQSPAMQVQIFGLMFGPDADPKAKSVGDAIDLITGARVESQTDKFFNRTVKTWALLSRKQQTSFFKLHENDVKRYARERGWIE